MTMTTDERVGVGNDNDDDNEDDNYEDDHDEYGVCSWKDDGGDA